jgi:hypothetical protein
LVIHGNKDKENPLRAQDGCGGSGTARFEGDNAVLSWTVSSRTFGLMPGERRRRKSNSQDREC